MRPRRGNEAETKTEEVDPFEEAERYDPSDISQFYNRTFKTRTSSCYSVTGEGKVAGKLTQEGATIDCIAGVDFETYKEIDTITKSIYYKYAKKKIDELLKAKGKRAGRDLHLVITLTEESMEKYEKWGFITSIINNTVPYQK